jgi:hypothetical protein
MVDFDTQTRKRCRHCKMNLPEPISNEREAFCTPGCYRSFYLHRCRVCEKPIEQKRDCRRILCKRSACRNAFSRNFAGGRYLYLSPSAPSYASKPPDFIGSKEATKPDRTWRIVAGPALTPSQFHAATVPDSEVIDGVPTWDGGSYQRIETQNRRQVDKHFAELEAEACKRDAAASLNRCSACGREDDLTDRAKPTLCYRCFNNLKTVQRVSRPDLVIAADLSIPAFLDRRIRPSELREAA